MASAPSGSQEGLVTMEEAKALWQEFFGAGGTPPSTIRTLSQFVATYE